MPLPSAAPVRRPAQRQRAAEKEARDTISVSMRQVVGVGIKKLLAVDLAADD
jgi:hypothetical protein